MKYISVFQLLHIYSWNNMLVYSQNVQVVFPTRWKGYPTTEYFLTLRNLSLRKCEIECAKRTKCKAVIYRTLTRVCDMASSIASDLPIENHANSVYVTRDDIQAKIMVLSSCQNCHENQTCNITDGSCSAGECLPLHMLNGGVLGNMQLLMAKAKVFCNVGYTLSTQDPISVCQSTGEWSNVPTCTAVGVDCGPPPTQANVESVSSGGTTEGSVRTYTCAFGHVIEIGGVKSLETSATATCDVNGAWTTDFECVENCPDGWKLLGSSCYGFTPSVPTATEGAEGCRTVDSNAHLADINTQTELSTLSNWTWTHSATFFSFIGGHTNAQGLWIWSDGTVIEEWGWADGEPDNDYPSNCLFISMANNDFLWYDYSCSVAMDAFCELEL